ncbi:uncharacterized protein ARMOST_02198 [Armillaria ostoyae]|uniref:Secreted protein n=1 Tax=Armillaria ostoyae TaxID=47428 RepID=A0A284QR17_ARMOS|nr:uncharacterized protein ARMOST_02198 [Armillaria ostoyae]
MNQYTWDRMILLSITMLLAPGRRQCKTSSTPGRRSFEKLVNTVCYFSFCGERRIHEQYRCYVVTKVTAKNVLDDTTHCYACFARGRSRNGAYIQNLDVAKKFSPSSRYQASMPPVRDILCRGLLSWIPSEHDKTTMHSPEVTLQRKGARCVRVFIFSK